MLLIFNRICANFFQLKMKPELHYGEDDCPVSVSDSFPKDAELNFEIELIDFSKVKARATNFILYTKFAIYRLLWV